MEEDNEMSELNTIYNAKVSFYKDFIERVKNNPAANTVNRYMVQNELLKGIQEAAKKAGLEADTFIKEQVEQTGEALKKFGVRFL